MSIFTRLWTSLAKPEPVSSPAADAAANPAVPAAAPQVERRNRARLDARKGVRALIIDDSPTIVAALRKILRSAGYLTLEAGDAEKGLELVAQEQPGLIFLDIILPGMNGFSALRAIRKDPLTQHIPVIMISGNENATEQFYVNRIGADDFMKKPFSRFEVFARIESLLDENRIPRRKTSVSELHAAQPAPAVPALAPAAAVPPPVVTPIPVAPQAAQPPSPVTVAAAGEARTSALEARKALNAMGLPYYDQGQFVAAIRRGDKLAIELFILGGGIQLNALEGGKSPLDVAREAAGSGDLAALLQKYGARQGAHPVNVVLAQHAAAK